MMKIRIKGFIDCKSGERFADCADNYSWNEEKHAFAISDGVSRSFFPKIWSRILVDNFVTRENFAEGPFIASCQNEWKQIVSEFVQKPDVKWFTKNQFNSNAAGLATFVGLCYSVMDKKWKAYYLGDSFLFFVPKNFPDFEKNVLKLSSKQKPFVFDNFPDYLSSVGNDHKGFPIRGLDIPQENGTFYLMTDALSEWFLTNKDHAIRQVEEWQDQTGFEAFIKKARECKEIADDDSAILVIEIDESQLPEICYDSSNVSKLEDLTNRQTKENPQGDTGMANINVILPNETSKPIELSIEPNFTAHRNCSLEKSGTTNKSSLDFVTSLKTFTKANKTCGRLYMMGKKGTIGTTKQDDTHALNAIVPEVLQLTTVSAVGLSKSPVIATNKSYNADTIAGTGDIDQEGEQLPEKETENISTQKIETPSSKEQSNKALENIFDKF